MLIQKNRLGVGRKKKSVTNTYCITTIVLLGILEFSWVLFCLHLLRVWSFCFWDWYCCFIASSGRCLLKKWFVLLLYWKVRQESFLGAQWHNSHGTNKTFRVDFDLRVPHATCCLRPTRHPGPFLSIVRTMSIYVKRALLVAREISLLQVEF